MESGKCKKPSKRVPVLWLDVVPKYTPGHSKFAPKWMKMQARKDAKAGNINYEWPARKGAKSGKIRRISGQAKKQRQARKGAKTGQKRPEVRQEKSQRDA